MRSGRSAFLLVAFLALSGLAAAASREECEGELQGWMQGEIPIQTNHDNATLTVDWEQLDAKLKEMGCSYDQLWMELWMVKELPGYEGDEQFGTAAYFAKFERCQELDDEHFIFTFHSSRPHSAKHLPDQQPDEATSLTVTDPGMSTTTFLHVVEDAYILRLCPCAPVLRRREPVCDCEYSKFGTTHCSKLLRVDVNTDKATDDGHGVYPWCREGYDGPDVSSGSVMESPATTCSSIILAGTMYSCTPIQSYDRVRVSLFQVYPPGGFEESGLATPADFACGQNNFVEAIIISKEEPLIGKAEKGAFISLIESLPENATFCIRVELVDQPYCNHHTPGISMLMPSICKNDVKQPVVLPKCSSGSSVTSETDQLSSEVIWGVVGVIGIIVCVGIAMAIFRCLRARGLLMVKDTKSLFFHHRNVTPGPAPARGADPVFMVHFPETRAFEAACGALRQYVEAGTEVFDLSDPRHDERISEDPEAWVSAVLGREGLRVIVIDSPLTRQFLLNSNSDDDDEKIPLYAGCPMPESALADHHHDLRVYSLRQVQSRLFGNYKKLVVVGFDGFWNGPSTSAADILTPHKQCLVLPEHFPELRSWLFGHRGRLSTSSQPRPLKDDDDPGLPSLPHPMLESQLVLAITEAASSHSESANTTMIV